MEGNTKVFSNLMWRFAERTGAQIVKFGVELLLARILLPEDYGLIALVTIFITVANVFVDSGLGNALIQKKGADELDFSTVFYFNIFWCLCIYCIVFSVAPYVAVLFSREDFSLILRVLGLQIIISGIKNVQQAYVSKNFLFKKFFYATLGGTIGAAVIGISLALNGLGVWALVAQQLFNIIVDTIILWITVKWRPLNKFSWNRLKELFSYGWKLLLSSLLEVIYNNIRQLFIGKFYLSSDLAFYNRGRQFPDFLISNVNNSIDSVLFPILSDVQDKKEKVRVMTKRSIKVSTYIIFPFMIGLAATGEQLVRIVLTDKWLPSIPYLRVFCFIFMFYPIHTSNLNAIKSLGRSDLFLRLEIFKKIIGISILILTMRLGVMVMAYSLLFTSVCSQILNSLPNKKLLNYGIKEQFKDIFPNLFLAFFMGIGVYLVGELRFNDIFKLSIQIFVGTFVYIFSSIITRNDSFYYLLVIIKNIKDK